MSKLNWTIKEHYGTPVWPLSQELLNLLEDKDYDLKPFSESHSCGLNDLQKGDEILVSHFFGYCKAKIENLNYEEKTGVATTECNAYLLKICEERNVWVCYCQMRIDKVDCEIKIVGDSNGI